jgi:uncharacterized membrane protein YfcA
LIPPQTFRVFLAITCPLILWVVWRKDLWVSREHQPSAKAAQSTRSLELRLCAAGIGVGFYDGLWGPGGGTFMLLALLFVAGLPLLPALGASKMANAASALASLSGYAWQGHVRWEYGLVGALGVSLSAWVGAHFATRNASRAVRPVLAGVVLLLLARLWAQSS